MTQLLQRELDQYNELETQHHTNTDLLSSLLADGLTIMCVNIRSLHKHFDELILLLADLKESVDIMVLTETWTNKDSYIPAIENYNSYHTNISKNKADGIVVYVKDSYNVVSLENNILDSTSLNVRLTVGGRVHTIVCVYRSPSFTDIEPFIQSLSQHLIHTSHTSSRVIVAGDININILESTNKHQLADEYLDLMMRCGFRSCIKQPTRVTPESESSIDHIFVNFDDIYMSMTLECSITDHFPTFLHIKISPTQHQSSSTQSFNSSINYKKLQTDLSTETWNNVYNSQSPNTAYLHFIHNLTTHVHNNTHSYIRKKKIKPIKPWITRGLIESIKVRDKLNMRRKQQPHNTHLTQQYRSYRNTPNRLIQTTKDTYYKQQIQRAGNSIKQVWNIIKEATDGTKKNKKGQIVELKLKNNELITVNKHPLQIANIFNTHFATIGSKMAQHILTTQNTTLQTILHNYTLPPQTQQSFFLFPTTENEVISTINSLNTNSAPGPDDLDNCLLKIINKYIALPLVHIFNLSFNVGYFPDDLKLSHIIPLLKNGDKSVLTNYRPISLTSNIGKTLEKIVKFRLVKYLDKFNIISKNQFGFRQGRGTHDAHFELTKFIVNSLDEGKRCIAVFLDLAKAFDTVSHPLLLKKLESIGIRGVALDWFTTYLTNRKQRVKIDHHLGDKAVVEFGIPQGTVLGPILYLIYANDLCNINIQGQIISFADDTALLFQANTWEGVVRLAEGELGRIKKWLNDNLLTLNFSKTKFLAFSLAATNQIQQQTIALHDCTTNPG